ncbi:MAG: hypothetical protein GX493_10730 [Firmicutes bacterium]|nr:hypothetical protein [Bacillota bacterium]
MRRLILAGVPVFFIVLVAGCGQPAPPAGTWVSPPHLRELGRPWPVEVGRFAAPFRLLAHDAGGILFTTGRPARRYRVDYRLRRLVPLGPAPAPGEEPYTAKTATEGDQRLLFIVQPDGSRLMVTSSLFATAWAQTGDRRALAFYETGPEGVQLVYSQPLVGIRQVWRRPVAPPATITLTWSPQGNYLVEERDGFLTVFPRAEGVPRWTASGLAVSFDPDERHLLYRQGETLRLLDLGGWYAEALPAPGDGRFLSAAWSPRGERVFYIYEKTGAEKTTRLLYLYEVEGGTWQRHPIPATLDPLTLAAFLHAKAAEAGTLLPLLPHLNEGTLCRLGEGFYLAGRDRELVLLDLSAKKVAPKTLHRFAGRVARLSLAGRRLVILIEEAEETTLYAWNLPVPAALTGIFPDRRDLGLGSLKLGMETAVVQTLLGTPLATEKGPDPLTEGRILLTHFYPAVAVTFARGRLEKILTTAPDLATPRGIKVGATRAEVLARYGRPDYEVRDYLAYRGTVDELSVKVAFKFDEEGRVAAILLAREKREEQKS